MLSTESGFCLGIPDVLHPTNVVEVQATVQSIREMDDGWSRYGLARADDNLGRGRPEQGPAYHHPGDPAAAAPPAGSQEKTAL